MVDLCQPEVFQGGTNVTIPRTYAPFDLSGNITGRQLTTTQINALATPLASQMVYNTTTNLYNFYNGTAWVALESSGGGSIDPGTVALASMSIIIGSASNVGVASSVIQVDPTHTSVGIDVTPPTATYKLQVGGSVYFSGSGSDLNVGRDIHAGIDNLGHVYSYHILAPAADVPLGLNENVRGVFVGNLSADPGTPSEGEFWYNTTGHVMKFYNGSAVKTITTN